MSHSEETVRENPAADHPAETHCGMRPGLPGPNIPAVYGVDCEPASHGAVTASLPRPRGSEVPASDPESGTSRHSSSRLSSGQEDAPARAGGFRVRVIVAGKMVTVRAEGPVDVETAPTLLERVESICIPGRRLVLDLRHSPYLDSAGVRALLRLQESLEGQQSELRLVVQPDSRVERTLHLLHLQKRFTIYESSSTAWLESTAA